MPIGGVFPIHRCLTSSVPGPFLRLTRQTNPVQLHPGLYVPTPPMSMTWDTLCSVTTQTPLFAPREWHPAWQHHSGSWLPSSSPHSKLPTQGGNRVLKAEWEKMGVNSKLKQRHFLTGSIKNQNEHLRKLWQPLL